MANNSPSKITEIEDDIIKYWFEDGILFNSFKNPPVDMNLKNIKEFISLRHKISNNEKQYWCSEGRGIKMYPKESRDYAEIYGQKYLHAVAVLVDSYFSLYIFNFFFKLKNVKIPFKAFKTKSEAVTWLNSIKQVNEKEKPVHQNQ